MNTLEIETKLCNDQRTIKAFRGVYASDELSTLTSTNSLFVCNTDLSDQPGSHWIVFYIDKQRKTDYFDSFGIAPKIQEIEQCFNNNSIVWT